jgi:hypothetical protein
MSDWIISLAIFHWQQLTGPEMRAGRRWGEEKKKKTGRNGMSPNVTDGQSREGGEKKLKKDGKITSEDWRRIRHHPIQLVAAH